MKQTVGGPVGFFVDVMIGLAGLILLFGGASFVNYRRLVRSAHLTTHSQRTLLRQQFSSKTFLLLCSLAVVAAAIVFAFDDGRSGFLQRVTAALALALLSFLVTRVRWTWGSILFLVAIGFTDVALLSRVDIAGGSNLNVVTLLVGVSIFAAVIVSLGTWIIAGIFATHIPKRRLHLEIPDEPISMPDDGKTK